MSSVLFKIILPTNYSFTNYIFYRYLQDLALNNQQILTWHKIQPTNQSIYLFIYLILSVSLLSHTLPPSFPQLNIHYGLLISVSM